MRTSKTPPPKLLPPPPLALFNRSNAESPPLPPPPPLVNADAAFCALRPPLEVSGPGAAVDPEGPAAASPADPEGPAAAAADAAAVRVFDRP